MSKLSKFTGLYQVFQTLKFELRPIGKTRENLERSGLLEQDLKRVDDYPKVKKFLDEQHKDFLQKVLGSTELDWQPLAEKIKAFQLNKDAKNDLEKEQSNYREKIVKKFSCDKNYTLLVKESTPSKFFKELLNAPAPVTDEVKTFERFACYFKGYNENRKNIYSAEAQQTSAAYRAVNENFSRFFNAVNIFSALQTHFPELLAGIVTRTADLLDGESVTDLLQINSYNRFLSQSGIDFINNIIGEINYAINQYRQQHQEIKSSSLPFIPVLYKQILSDREHLFSVNGFENDAEVYSALRKFIENNQNAEINGSSVELFSSLQKELCNLNEDCRLFIDAKSLEKISVKLTGYWNTINEARNDFAQKTIKGKSNQGKYCKQAVYSFQEIKSWKIGKRLENGSIRGVDFTVFWHGEYAAGLFETEKKYLSEMQALLTRKPENLRADKEQVQIIKEYLDAVQEIFHLVKILVVGDEYDGDTALQGTLSAYSQKLAVVIPLYNQVRNYVTKRDTEVAKIKLMFNNPIFASGWPDVQANSCVLFKNGAAFYLGILSDKHRTCLNKIVQPNSSETNLWEKMNLSQMADPSNDLPTLLQINGKTDRKTGRKDKITEENKILEELKNRYLPENINRIRKSGSYGTGSSSFSREDLNAYIDFYKERIIEYKPDAVFNFKKSSEYPNWSSFTEDLKAQAYQVGFSEISPEFIFKLVDEGKLYLFQIWNKDFSEKSTGVANKSTLYWKEIFSPENLADAVFKLNGEAELFMRPQAIKEKRAHAVGEKLVNRTVVTEVDEKTDRAVREAVPENIHHEIFLYVNGKKAIADLSAETMDYIKKYPILHWHKGMPIGNARNRTIVKPAVFELVKDKRYTEDKFFFHVPIAINFKSPGSPVKFNDRVWEYLKDNPDVKIIGLDRGERNLIYLTLIDQQGRILKQKSLNSINGADYHAKLALREKERDAARKNWNSIGQIKDLKAGYLSGVVYEIARMMVEENAIVVMEDLNSGFKRSRTKIEKQIYQKFEKALIEKLNYLVFKTETDHRSPGGVSAGYQLANKFKSFKKLGKQCGFIFYVPAAFTSKIDPATGFVNLFNTAECTNAENIKLFFDKFEAIKYDAVRDAFAFTFDYRNFKTSQQDYQNRWTVYSTKEAYRTEKDKSSGKYSAVLHNPAKEIKDALRKAGVKLSNHFDLLEFLRKTSPSRTNASLFFDIFGAFMLSVALRHRSAEDDKIISPVMDVNGNFFTSGLRKNHAAPQDADANGAFHIALKGLYLLRHGVKDKISTADYLKFVQGRHK